MIKNTRKTWFKKGSISWNKGLHIQSNNALEIWRKNGGQTWCKGKHPWKDKLHPMLGKIPKNKGKKSGQVKLCKSCGKGFYVYPFRIKTAQFCSFKCRPQHFKKMHIPFNKGIPWTQEAKIKISKSRTGKKLTSEQKRKISNSLKGHIGYWKDKEHSIETKRKMKLIRIKNREKQWNWRGGISSLTTIIKTSSEWRNWRKQIFNRDNYTCQECFVHGIKLHPHHKDKSFSQIFQEFLHQYSQFSPIEDKETLVRLATTYEPFWDINNGITLCEECHKKTPNYKVLEHFKKRRYI